MASSPDPHIARVYVWQNQMVMVFDDNGEQVPEYQGHIDKVGERLAAIFPREFWIHGIWNETYRAAMPMTTCRICGGTALTCSECHLMGRVIKRTIGCWRECPNGHRWMCMTGLVRNSCHAANLGP